MKLPVYRDLKHLSHTSVQEWKRCQMLFYLKRLSKYEWPKNPQGAAAAVGSVFDCVIKHEFLKRKGHTNNLRADLVKALEPENLKDDLLSYGQGLAQLYIKEGFLDHLIKEDLVGVDYKKEGTLDIPLDGNTVSVPILGYPDGVYADGHILEFKVRGAMSNSGAYGTAGYNYRSINGVGDSRPHERDGFPMHELAEVWARQMTVYDYFSFGPRTLEMNTPVAVEEIAIKPKSDGGLRICIQRIRSYLEPAFKRAVMEDIAKVYLQIQAEDFEVAQPTQRRCFMWGTECPVAENCDKFQQIYGENADPAMKACMT